MIFTKCVPERLPIFLKSIANEIKFFFRTADADAERFLKLFTLVPLPEIATIMEEQNADASKRPAQRRLAHEVISLVYGVPEAEKIAFEQGQLFRQPSPASSPSSKPAKVLDATDINASTNVNAAQINAATTLTHSVTLPRSVLKDQPIARILYAAGLVSSRAEGYRLSIAGGAYVGGQKGQSWQIGQDVKWVPIKDQHPGAVWSYVVDETRLFMRVGKWKVKVVEVVSDEEFAARGLDAPGLNQLKEVEEKAQLKKEAKKEKKVAERAEEQFSFGGSVSGDSGKNAFKRDIRKLASPVFERKIGERDKERVLGVLGMKDRGGLPKPRGARPPLKSWSSRPREAYGTTDDVDPEPEDTHAKVQKSHYENRPMKQASFVAERKSFSTDRRRVGPPGGRHFENRSTKQTGYDPERKRSPTDRGRQGTPGDRHFENRSTKQAGFAAERKRFPTDRRRQGAPADRMTASRPRRSYEGPSRARRI